MAEMNGKLHIIWDMDGTLVDSGPEVYATIEKCLAQVGVSMSDAIRPLRIGPPVKEIMRASFTEEVLTDELLYKAVAAFRDIYDSSEYEATIPFDGIDELLHNTDYIHHIITNKPDLPTNKILNMKGWSKCILDVLTPNTHEKETGRALKKQELFQRFKSEHAIDRMVGIGDMSTDALYAHSIGIPAIGVLWGAGTKEELVGAKCDYIVKDIAELNSILNNYK